MKRSFTITGCLLLLLLAASPRFIGNAKADQDNDSEKLIKAARFLEQKPLDKDAKKIRGWAIEWLTVTDKVSVKVCSLLLGVDKKYKYSGELWPIHNRDGRVQVV